MDLVEDLEKVKLLAWDLTQTPPRSPNALLGGYVILARTIDKCRADLIGKVGGYHWNCGLAKWFFEFKGLDPEAFREHVAAGWSDEDLLGWINSHGIHRSETDILAWSYDCRCHRPDTPEMKAYVEQNIRALNREAPTIYTFFQMLDAEEGRI